MSLAYSIILCVNTTTKVVSRRFAVWEATNVSNNTLKVVASLRGRMG